METRHYSMVGYPTIRDDFTMIEKSQEEIASENYIERCHTMINTHARRPFDLLEVDLAFSEPLSQSGMVNRIKAKHGAYLAYYKSDGAFRVYKAAAGYHEKKWIPVENGNVINLIERELRLLSKELEIITIAENCGLLNDMSTKQLKKIEELRERYKHPVAMSELVYALSKELDIRNRKRKSL